MHLFTLLVLSLAHFTLSNASVCPAPAGCGTAQACIGTEFCTTATFVSPTTTTITTCVPTATCAGHPAKQAAQVQLVARDTAQQLGADRPTTLTRSVVRIMDLVLWMIIAVMGIFVWTGFVQGLDEIGKGKGEGKGIWSVEEFVMHVW
ncbi:hypothetical protein N7444_006580 [Penicillium canescens]|nr:hypothetical protein N7444_006580 [Penicillium canescens]KAJ6182286.1 hypothetical protein N7485_000928 [Penicillium canescens]